MFVQSKPLYYLIWVLRTPLFVVGLNEEISMLDNPLMVLTPIGEVYSVNKVLRGCEVRIENKVFSANLVVLDILKFDVIWAWIGYLPTMWY